MDPQAPEQLLWLIAFMLPTGHHTQHRMVLTAIKMEVTHLFVLPTNNILPRKILHAKILYPKLRLCDFFFF